MGDECGVIVIQKDFAADILERVTKQRESLRAYTENVRKGIFSNAWVDAMLEAHNCTFLD